MPTACFSLNRHEENGDKDELIGISKVIASEEDDLSSEASAQEETGDTEDGKEAAEGEAPADAPEAASEE